MEGLHCVAMRMVHSGHIREICCLSLRHPSGIPLGHPRHATMVNTGTSRHATMKSMHLPPS